MAEKFFVLLEASLYTWWPDCGATKCLWERVYRPIGHTYTKTKLTRLELRHAVPLALEESYWRLTARSVTIVGTIREV
jgi:hypothetical protein